MSTKMRVLHMLVCTRGHCCWSIRRGCLCGGIHAAVVNVLECMCTGTLRMVPEDCRVWLKLLKNKSLTILAKCVTGEGMVLPRGQLEQSSLSGFLLGGSGRGWGEEGSGRDVYVSVKCSSCMDQPVRTAVNANQTDGLGAWEHHTVTGNW